MMQNKYIEIKSSKIHGKGIFAKTNIPKGIKIIEYIGNKITKKQSDILYDKSTEKEEKENKQLTTYIFELNKKWDIDGNVSWNPARLINHSCDSNCESYNESGRIWVASLKEIKKGEELNYDYGFPLENYKDHPCRCNAKTCPGFIVPKKDRKKLMLELNH